MATKIIYGEKVMESVIEDGWVEQMAEKAKRRYWPYPYLKPWHPGPGKPIPPGED